MAGWNLPADETGGDFYDWQTFPSGDLVVVLGDVPGHGLGPAILAAVRRAYARASLSVQDETDQCSSCARLDARPFLLHWWPRSAP